MRILMQTDDPVTEHSYLEAADKVNRQRLYVLHNEAQILERLFRDRFDALIVDKADRQKTWLRINDRQNVSNLILLLQDPASASVLPETVTYGFLRTYEPIEVLKRIDTFPPGRTGEARAETVISRTLQRIGVPAHLKGFPILKEAIRLLLSVDRPTEIRLVEDVYALLASELHMSPTVVEHAIRHAIESAWLRADLKELEAMFGDTVSAERAAPSNAGFLFILADRIRIEQGRAVS